MPSSDHDAAVRAAERERIAAQLERRAEQESAITGSGWLLTQYAADTLRELATLIREGRE